MSGPIGLHGGGEYVAGDEPFLDALLHAAREAAVARAATARAATARQAAAVARAATARQAAAVRAPATMQETAPGLDPDRDPDRAADLDVSGHAIEPLPRVVRVVVVPTAASRGFPDRAAATGVGAFERRASAIGLTVAVVVARVVDGESARDARIVQRLGEADLIHLPGGDPDLIPTILADTPALAAIRAASRAGAVVAGASAGAMALAEWTWTPRGGMHGLAFVDGLAVIPHYDDVRRTTWQEALDGLAPGGIGYLGLDERTGVIATPNGTAERAWRVTGPGAAWWFARGGGDPTVARDGELLRLPA